MSRDLPPRYAQLVATAALLIALALVGVCGETVGRCAAPEPDTVGLHAPDDPAACGRALTPELRRLGLVCPPFAGILVPPGALRSLLRAGDDLDAERAGRALDVRAAADARELAAEQHRADVAALEQRLAAADASRRACEQDKAPAPRARPWYESPVVLVGAGVVVGVGLAVAVVEAAR